MFIRPSFRSVRPSVRPHTLTHVGLVLEGMVAVVALAMKVRRLLAEEGARLEQTIFGGAKALEALLDDGRVLAMVVGVHLHVRRADVHLVAATLQAMVVRLLAMVRAVGEALDALVDGRTAKEAMGERFVALLVPLEVPNHLLLLHEDARVARLRIAMKVLAIVQLAAQIVATFGGVRVPSGGNGNDDIDPTQQQVLMSLIRHAAN